MARRKRTDTGRVHAVGIELKARFKRWQNLYEDVAAGKKVREADVKEAVNNLESDVSVGNAYVSIDTISKNNQYKSALPKNYLKFMGDLQRLQRKAPERILNAEDYEVYVQQQLVSKEETDKLTTAEKSESVVVELKSESVVVEPKSESVVVEPKSVSVASKTEAPVSKSSSTKSEDPSLWRIFEAFEKDIKNIGKHKKAAAGFAQHLADDLKLKIVDYYQNLKDKRNNAAEIFMQESRDLINAAMGPLKRDLGWGDYLKNLLKKFANAVLMVPYSVGIKVGFFAIKPSYAEQRVNELQGNFEEKLSATTA